MPAFLRTPELQRLRLSAYLDGETRFIGGSVDTLYIPGRHRERLLHTLGLFLETNCFLEIALPTVLHLVVPFDEEILYVDHVGLSLSAQDNLSDVVNSSTGSGTRHSTATSSAINGARASKSTPSTPSIGVMYRKTASGAATPTSSRIRATSYASLLLVKGRSFLDSGECAALSTYHRACIGRLLIPPGRSQDGFQS